jgi:hypothetical protein
MSKEPTIQNLSEVLENVDDIYYGDVLFLNKDNPLTAESYCAVFNDGYIQEVLQTKEDDLNNSRFAKENGLHAFTNIGVVQDIKSNAKQQKPNLTPIELLKAFNFYYTHDAFIDFGDLTNQMTCSIL